MGHVCVDHVALGIESHGPSMKVSIIGAAEGTSQGTCGYCGAKARYEFN